MRLVLRTRTESENPPGQMHVRFTPSEPASTTGPGPGMSTAGGVELSGYLPIAEAMQFSVGTAYDVSFAPAPVDPRPE
ncbi:MAG TPA: hypothetical protein VFE72_02775 [Lysobacter sp.]|nr:hypothetical protein [Lysobacter sp.]